MYGYEQRGVKYDTLYGYAPTREEWEAEQADRKAKGWWGESEFRKPWHCGWQRQHNGGTDMNGEWYFSGSWTCKKIIRPSYDQSTAINLVVNIGGKRKRGAHRPTYWTASLEMGHGPRSSFWDQMQKPKSCNSIADACRKAEKLPFIDEEVKKLLKRAYSVTNAEAIYRKVGDDYVPYMTRLRLGGSPHDWQSGEYFSTHWNKPWQGPKKDQWGLEGTHVHVSGYGYGSGPYHEPGTPYSKGMIAVHHAMVEATGCWLPKPVDQPQ